MGATRRTLLAAGAVAPAAALAVAGPAQGATPYWVPPTYGPNGQIRILCLGDSRTEGMGDTNPATGAPDWNGYRKPLLDMLRGPAEKHDAVMVGSQVDGSARIPHEGWSGKTINYLTGIVNGGVLDNPGPTFTGPPHIVVVQCGANDAGAGRSPEQMLTDMTALLRAILAVSSNLRVVLCEETVMSGALNHRITEATLFQQAYNDGLPGVIQAVDPARISFVRCGDIPESMLFDGIHLGHAGYALLAAYIYAAGMPPWLGFRQRYLPSIDWPTDRIPRERLNPV